VHNLLYTHILNGVTDYEVHTLNGFPNILTYLQLSNLSPTKGNTV